MSTPRLQRPTPRTGNARQRTSQLKLVAVSLAFAAALAATGYYALRLLSGPVVKPVPTADSRPQQSKSPTGSTILATPASKAPAQPQTTLSRIGQVEAAKQNKPAGPLYDPRSSNAALAYESLPLESPQVAEAQAVLTKYAQAATWRERLPFVFAPERIEALMQEQYEKRGQKDPEHGGLLAAGIITAGTSTVLNLQFACATRPDAGMRANFHRNRNGKLMLDWESWVAWTEKTWPEFKQEHSQLSVVMRAVASESSYYNYEFSEGWRWLAVKLRSPDGLHNVTGYIERNTVLGIALANLIGVPLPHKLPDGTPMPALKLPGSKALVTVRLAFPAKAQSDHCVNITEILADRWLLFPGEGK
ncbi:MAG: hypothetical protein ACKVY0_24375 [Prosthecobacter sp.]|uniref:hypothetical protein n=1 Tax=Prosthecobacter sp. TaxID=1965333 RepID=UPI00390011BD